MSTFKTYAKQAKQRLKSDFWSKVKEERELIKNNSQNEGASSDGLIAKQRQDIKEKIYNTNYESDEQFFERVKALLESPEIVVNPIALLADKEALNTMPDSQKQSYLLKLSSRYQAAVQKYNDMIKKIM